MSDDDTERRRTGAPLFVYSCVAGFLIISGCAAYFVVKFFF
ncbi:MAG TPA: hypothetical protein VHY32_04975 [Caulobacteraceae bacterium]|jgi:uncharacterized membrane protein|nr:hypothetical protein [Caulobacteraceae bacterium]